MDFALKCNIHSPEMTRFINATYYRGRYREKINYSRDMTCEETADVDIGTKNSENQSGI